MLDTFEVDLKAVVGYPTALRPFICDGSPLDCRIFFVGLNPATPMKAGFWDFWIPGVGFDRATWFETYKEERVARRPRPGKSRVLAVSRTRRLVNHMRDGLGGIKVLETNIYSTAAPTYRELGREQRDTTAFDFLLDRIKPKLLVAFGNDVHRHLSERNLDAQIIELPHFADRKAGWSNSNAYRLGEECAHALGVTCASGRNGTPKGTFKDLPPFRCCL